MVLDALLTKIEVDRFSSELVVRFKDLGQIHHPWKHLFVTEMLGRKTFDEQERKQNSLNYKRVHNALKRNLKLRKYFIEHENPDKRNPRDKLTYWTIIQWYGPTNLADQLPNEFITGNYNKQARWRLATPFNYITLDDVTEKALKQTKRIEQKLYSFERKIRENRSPSSATRLLNDVDEIFDKYNSINDEKIISLISKNKRVNSLKTDLIVERKQIAKSIINLNSQINPELKLIYAPLKSNKRNHSLKLFKNSYKYLEHGRMITGEEFLSYMHLFFDIEIPLFKGVNGVGIDNTLYFIGANFFQFPESEIVIYNVSNQPSETLNFENQSVLLKSAKTETESINNLVVDVRENSKNLIGIIAHNAYFDISKIRQTSAGFSVGVDSSDPRLEATTNFFKRFKIEDYLVIDTLNWARIAKAYDFNFKLEMVAGFEKIINYDEMAVLQTDINSNSETSRASFEKVAKYQVEDITKPTENILLTKLFKKTIIDAFNLSSMYKIPINRLLYSPNTINDVQERAYFKKLGVYRDRVPPHFKKTSMEKQRQKAKNFFKKHIIEKKLDSKNKLGLSADVYKVFLPLGDLFNDTIKIRFPDISHLIKYKSSIKEDKERLFFLEQYNNAFTRWIVEDYGLYLIDEKQYDSLLKKHNLVESEFEDSYHQFRIHLSKNSKENLKRLDEDNLLVTATEEFSEPILEYIEENKSLDFKAFTELANTRSKVKRRGRNIVGNYAVFPSRRFFNMEKRIKHKNVIILDEYIQNKLNHINTFLEKNDLEIIAQEGYYLYLTGNSKTLNSFDCPVIKVDEISELFNSDKPYYEKNGFMSHMNLEKEAHYNLCEFETQVYGPILKHFLAGENYEAQNLFHESLSELETETIDKTKLLYLNKSKQIYMAYAEESESSDNKLYFITDEKHVPLVKNDEDKLERKDVFTDSKKNMKYFIENIRGKSIPVYIMQKDDFTPIFSKYTDILVKKSSKIMKPVFEVDKKDTEQYAFALID